MEDDLVILLEKIQGTEFKVGEDVGIISYNETPWKHFILDSITISSDFKKMGKMVDNLIFGNSKKHIEVPFALTLRNPL